MDNTSQDFQAQHENQMQQSYNSQQQPNVSASEKSDVVINEEFSEKISRLFIFRFLWIYPLMFVMIVWGIWINIIEFFHFWYMLILGKRNRTMWEKKVKFFNHITKWQSYFMSITDKRPPLK